MRFATVVGMALTAACTVSAGVAAPVSDSQKLAARQRVPNEGDVRSRCEGRTPHDGEHVLGIVWSQHGTIGGDGNPAIGDSGAFYIFSHNCNRLGALEWNGGRGDFTIPFEGDREMTFSIEGSVLTNHPPATPSNVKVNGEDVPYVDCIRDSNSGFGYASHYRTCSMRW